MTHDVWLLHKSLTVLFSNARATRAGREATIFRKRGKCQVRNLPARCVILPTVKRAGLEAEGEVKRRIKKMAKRIKGEGEVAKRGKEPYSFILLFPFSPLPYTSASLLLVLPTSR